MDSPTGGAVSGSVVAAVERMRSNATARDAAMAKVRAVRRGEFASLWPDSFSERYPTAIVANFVDVAARDLAAKLAGLPALVCSAGNTRSDVDKRRAERMNRIGANYWRASMLRKQMKYGADQYLTYGFLPIWVEADYKRNLPIMHVEDPLGAYFELDRWFKCQKYAKTWRQDVGELAAMFPEYASIILTDRTGMPARTGSDTEVVRYIDDTWCVLYLPDRSNLAVASYRHKMGYCPVVIGTRPGLEAEPRGQFDDVIYVQLAHTVMAALTLEAGHKAVQAPMAVPSDMQELSIGPDAVMVTDQPDKIRRVPIDVPQAAFALSAQLSQELHDGAGYPDTRMGQGPAGGSTGRGISALEGGFDTMIGLGQDVLGDLIRDSSEMCFDMEVKLWPNRPKTINGTLSGESFSLTYIPSKDLSGETRCEVSYGFASGLSPNSSIVTLLQLRGDNIISRDMFRRQLPFDIDVDQAQRELDVQETEDAMKQGLAAGLTATGQMIAQGQVAEAMQFFTAGAKVIEGRRQGKDLSSLFVEAFTPPPPPPQQPGMPGAPGAPGAPGDPGDPLAGVAPNGLPSGVAPGQAALGPGGRPSLQDLTASFTGSGAPSLGDSVRRRMPTG